MNDSVFFSVIIATRNRPALFAKALASVMAQQFDDKEIIVINDGSDEEQHDAYQAIIDQYPAVRYIPLIKRENGHGQSYSLNFGASVAKGEYLAFLDDDDLWSNSEHLSRAYQDIRASKRKVELYFTNQEAFYANGEQKQDPCWLGDLVARLPENQSAPYVVNVDFLLKSDGFAHLNCSIYHKEFYLALGGMDENIRYECDRDIYIRALDAANHILYQPWVVAQHYIPDKSQANNMSTSVSEHEKRLYQLRVYEKGILNCKQAALRRLCIVGKTYQLKFLAESLNKHHKPHSALLYAKQALSLHYSVKWHLFVIYLRVSKMLDKAA